MEPNGLWVHIEKLRRDKQTVCNPELLTAFITDIHDTISIRNNGNEACHLLARFHSNYQLNNVFQVTLKRKVALITIDTKVHVTVRSTTLLSKTKST